MRQLRAIQRLESGDQGLFQQPGALQEPVSKLVAGAGGADDQSIDTAFSQHDPTGLVDDTRDPGNYETGSQNHRSAAGTP
jgi:hypothetical protein